MQKKVTKGHVTHVMRTPGENDDVEDGGHNMRAERSVFTKLDCKSGHKSSY